MMRLISFALIFALTLGGCTRKARDLEVDLPNGQKLTLPLGETLRININSEPPSLDWHKATDTTSALIGDNIMEGLATYDLSDKELGLLPALATKWEASNGSQTWKLTLRQGVKWTDGVEFTAQHVYDGWKRLLDPATASEYSYFLYGIKNARAFNEGKIKDFAQVGVKMNGPTEMVVELEQPMSYFPYLLTHHSTFPIRMDAIEKHGDQWTEPENIVTLGPYKLKVWQHDKMIVMEKNETYFETPAETDYIVAYMIQEASTALNLFDAGKIDALNSLPSTELRKLKQRKEYREVGTLVLQYYGTNTAKPPMDNPKVRQAISHAIDRKEIVQILAGGQIPMTSWVPAGMFGYEAERGLSFNPEKAKALLKEAGYDDPAKLPKLTLGFNTNEDHQRVAENIQAQLKRNLGLDLELKNEEWKVYLSSLKTDPPHIFRSGWQADYPDPDNFMNLMTSYSENNRTRWKNLKFDELISKAAREGDKDKRRGLYSEAQMLLVETDVPAIPLFTAVSHLLVSDRVENYPVNALARFTFKGVKVK